jgi:glyoxylase-like metal-dependent hydrolase (beta-lactamase superfamily II)
VLFADTGPVKERFYVLGSSTFPIHLLDGAKPVVFDAGVACAGKIYAEAIRSVTGAKEPEMLFLTHTHWDHCGATAYLKKVFPSMKIAASQRAMDNLKRRRVIELIGRLNEDIRPAIAGMSGIDPAGLIDESFQPFEIDMILEDGMAIKPDRNTIIEVLATPGHTMDHLSYYIPEEKVLIAAEASGCQDSMGDIVTEFLADYDAYFASLKRLAALPVEVLCQGHRIVFTEKCEVESYFARAVDEAVSFKNRVCELLEGETGSIDSVIRQIKAERYDTNTGVKQPETAYLLNLKAQVIHLARNRNRRL